MTSSTGADTVLRELRFGTGRQAAVDDARFHFTLDFDSAQQPWPDVPYDTSMPSARHDGDARTRVRAVLDDAAIAMARVPTALHLVNAQLQQVLLRQSKAAPGGSASHRSQVGRCLLTNLHTSAHAVPVAVEALTHEAIHQLLYRTEQASGHFCDLSPLPTFRSPWTGARLPMHSLVHASFVWFGLLALWSELALVPADDEEAAHARGRMAHCLFGFAFLDDLLDGPGFPAASVQPAALQALRTMTAMARHAAQVAEPATTLRQLGNARQSAGWPAAVAAGLA